MWAKRAESEFRDTERQGGRTWFVTLTFKPEEHYRLHTMTRQRLAKAGADLDKLDWSGAYSELLEEYHAELERFFDRLRVGLATRGWPPANFRYLAVPEPHKGSQIRVHYHVLLHEALHVKSGQFVPLKRRRIEQAWRGAPNGEAAQHGPRARRDLGFVRALLVPTPRDTQYVCKYLGKHHYEGRLRVSKRYGQQSEQAPEAALKEPAVPDPPARVKRARPPPDPGYDTPALERAVLASRTEDDDTERVLIGEYLGVCPSGLHIGTGCECEPEPGAPECVPVEFDELRGTPRRKWPLRGWHQTNAGAVQLHDDDDPLIVDHRARH